MNRLCRLTKKVRMVTFMLSPKLDDLCIVKTNNKYVFPVHTTRINPFGLVGGGGVGGGGSN